MNQVNVVLAAQNGSAASGRWMSGLGGKADVPSDARRCRLGPKADVAAVWSNDVLTLEFGDCCCFSPEKMARGVHGCYAI